MKKHRTAKLSLPRETIRAITAAELTAAAGGLPDQSIVYWCPTNGSIARSCSSC